MKYTCVLILAFVSACAAQGAPPKPPPKDEDYNESVGCTEKCETTFTSLAEMLGKNEPATMTDCNPCEKCDVTDLKTIQIKTDTIVKMCDDGNDPEGMYYILQMEFRNISVDCFGCKAKNAQTMGDEKGRYTGYWEGPHVEVRCFKPEWNGNQLNVIGSQVVTKMEKGMVKGTCSDPVDGDWIDTCKQANDAGLFDGVFYAACQSLFQAKANEKLEEDKKNKEGGGGDTLAKQMTCNKDDKEESK